MTNNARRCSFPVDVCTIPAAHVATVACCAVVVSYYIRVASGGADVQLLNGTSYGCVRANIVVGCARANKVVRYHSRMVQMFDLFRIHIYRTG